MQIKWALLIEEDFLKNLHSTSWRKNLCVFVFETPTPAPPPPPPKKRTMLWRNHLRHNTLFQNLNIPWVIYEDLNWV